jgi:uncharacterized membrane protein
MTPETIAQLSKPPRFALVVFALSAVAVTLPIFGGYFTSFLLLLWLVLTRPRRHVVDAAAAERFSHIVRPVHLGVAILLGTHLLAAVIAYLGDAAAPSFAAAFKPSGHMTIKWGLLWYLLSGAVRTMLARGWRPLSVGKWLALWLLVHFVYCLVQRHTGIDWTHGLGARLGANRFAYDVYRVSGFMGHPLTLGYNLVLLVLVALPFARAEWTGEQRWAWPTVLALAAATLVISGSRFPLVALALSLAMSLGSVLWKWRWQLLAASVALFAGLALEGSTLRRVSELFDPQKPVTERFDRIVFWQVHWRVFLEHPFVGTGLWGIDAATEREYRAIGFTERMYGAHDIFLQQMADTGAVGLAGLLVLLGGIFLAGRRAAQAVGTWNAVTPLAWAAVATGLMQNNFRDSEFVFACWFLLALAAGDAARRGTSPVKPA